MMVIIKLVKRELSGSHLHLLELIGCWLAQ